MFEFNGYKLYSFVIFILKLTGKYLFYFQIGFKSDRLRIEFGTSEFPLVYIHNLSIGEFSIIIFSFYSKKVHCTLEYYFYFSK